MRRVAGSLYGLAIGDALGAPTEFIGSVSQIEDSFGPGGPSDLRGEPARVTDDTQMALAVGRALVSGAEQGNLTAATLEPALREEFVAWLHSPDNDRAPGNTCLEACHRLARGSPWMEATLRGSKGCGANMRVAVVGLIPTGWAGVGQTTRAAIAQYQAAFTHGHPTALAASDLTAFAVAELKDGCDASELTARLRAYAHAQRAVWHGEWLAGLWQQPGFASPEEFISRGWDECGMILDRLDEALAVGDRRRDPCLATGAGWIAEEALGTALLCFLLFSDDPVAAIRRAATTSGDSDSIACLAGAFAGAAHGLDAWPADWRRRIEYQRELDRLVRAWDPA